MTDELNKASTEADGGEEKQEKVTLAEIKIEVQSETPEEKQEEERPGFCCGSCT
ncbi:MAG: hypothetical protein ABW148_03910 [Sedimenticola sp.]